MQPVTTVRSHAVPLNRSDVDTDQIIPSDWLKRVERTGFGAGLFSEWRENADFVLNDPKHEGARILLAKTNFGTGSSREHAVWALMDFGFSAIVSPRFGDIFRNNSTKNGLLTAQISAEAVDRLFAAVHADPETEIVVDVEQLRVTCEAADVDESFPLDEFTQYRFLNGLDDIGITLASEGDIDTFENKRPSFKPVTVPERP